MSDDSLFTGMTRRQRLVAEISYLQLKGAGLAAVVVFGAWIMIAVLSWFGKTILAEDSQLADDPAPAAFQNMPDQ